MIDHEAVMAQQRLDQEMVEEWELSRDWENANIEPFDPLNREMKALAQQLGYGGGQYEFEETFSIGATKLG